MPGTMDGYMISEGGGLYSVRFAGQTISGLTDGEAREELRGLADGRALWFFTGETHVPLDLG